MIYLRYVIGSVILTAVFLLLIGLFIEQTNPSAFSIPSVSTFFLSPKIHADFSQDHVETLQSFDSISSWYGLYDEVMMPNLRNSVTLVNFWSLHCDSCVQTLEEIQSIYEDFKNQNMHVVSILDPQDIQEDQDIYQIMDNLGITFMVGVDDLHEVWGSYENTVWPTTYIFDQDWNLVYTQIGAGEQGDIRTHLLDFLELQEEDLIPPEPEIVVRQGTFFGYKRSPRKGGKERFANDELISRDTAHNYTFPLSMEPLDWALQGNWIVTAEYAELASAPGRVKYHFIGDNIRVATSYFEEGQSKVYVLLDGKPVPKEWKGEDLFINDEGSYFIAEKFTTDNILLLPEQGEHELEFIVNDKQVRMNGIDDLD